MYRYALALSERPDERCGAVSNRNKGACVLLTFVGVSPFRDGPRGGRATNDKFERTIELVGHEQYRMWIAYLAGVTGGFEHGPLHIFQTVAAKQSIRADSLLPPTRDDIYHSSTPLGRQTAAS